MSTNTSAAELKTQGVVEAAQDPNSSVTADDAQQKIVTESKKAGVAAFTFDPDASPEEKAAQARAVSTLRTDSSRTADSLRYSVSQKGFTTNTSQKELQYPQI
jgi:hypothetical protein